MNGRKKARIERCGRCRQRFTRHEKHAGPHGYSRFCGAEDRPIELHDSYMEGPDSNCPLGYWADLEPVGPMDPEKWKRWNRGRRRDRARQTRKPGLKDRVRQIADSADIRADAETALAVLVAAGAAPGWLADEIKSELKAAT